ncbi:hypothetical protein FHR99_001204 [Litorivivens lipolytica]|uniref:Uncharacterized protein n=1 Tax=Litorivivens lipolytica TaxID=1524264 RepID=A0A7W4Z589_9GAMM|nr:BcsR/BcsP family cellulose biosynthesis protein [Litorivivens lipolytica]MBB3046968.1 hypothetical protein [Litorivivens lipolytica]
MSELSEDIRAVYQAFGRKDLSYQEITERLEYRAVTDKWPLLRLLHSENTEKAEESGS